VEVAKEALARFFEVVHDAADWALGEFAKKIPHRIYKVATYTIV
jgi:hypothetical protein